MTTYRGRHFDLAADLGTAAEWPCAAPGCERPAHDWALTGRATSEGPHNGREARWSVLDDAYRPLCRSHHWMHDKGGDFEHCPRGHDRATAGVSGTGCRACDRDSSRDRARRRRALKDHPHERVHRPTGHNRKDHPVIAYNLGALAPAVQSYLSTLNAVLLDDPNLSDLGNAERRRTAVATAQAALTALSPAEPAPVDRSAVFDALRPHTVDDVATQGREREKVAALLDAGRNLGRIIGDGDRLRLAAIADTIETMPQVLESPDGEAIAAEVRDAIFARLVDLGEPDAVKVATLEAEAAPALAARAFIVDTIANGAPAYEGLAAVERVDTEPVPGSPCRHR